jgi:aminoglycoside 3-N-acetyltransferase I
MAGGIEVERLTSADIARARVLFALMSNVFGDVSERLGDNYLTHLLSRDEFWAMAALLDGQLVGGLTAHTLALTRAEAREVFIYDLAVAPAYQRQGVGRQLVMALRAQAAARGVAVVFVSADDEDAHALEFYRTLGGTPAPVTIFTFSEVGERSQPG